MRYSYELVHPCDGVIIPQNATIQRHPAPGLTLGTLIAIEAMSALLIRSDSMVYTEDEIADRACIMADALLRRMP